MPSIAIQAARQAISAATAKGLLTVADNSYLFPGANAWVSLDNGSAQVRVKILARIGTTQVLVRAYPVKYDPYLKVSYSSEQWGPPSYGYSNMSAYNGSAHIDQEAQSAPVDPAYATRVVP